MNKLLYKMPTNSNISQQTWVKHSHLIIHLSTKMKLGFQINVTQDKKLKHVLPSLVEFSSPF
ncbi:hypothetical protein GIB67_002106 [Kingdonia uniflora]|uniref:Uncharacterized protein n=1 Tax=Kingdonia uniflora TaxID=39325 RepID=A0A7J7KWF2_9MAGN|nr:hypothetical protein GIB67_002106 [Kingdonia uniflora]